MPLRKEDIERIQREAKEYRNENSKFVPDNQSEIMLEKAYISGASTEAEKANELVESLEKELKDLRAYVAYVGRRLNNYEIPMSYDAYK